MQSKDKTRDKTKAASAPEKANLTLKLDRTLLKEIRVLAAEQDTSISALLTVHLEQIVKHRSGYERAKHRAIARMRKGWNLGWQKPASRDELHER
jgi:hypothetical protein